MMLASRTGAWAKDRTPAIHLEDAADGGIIITRKFDSGCRFLIDLEVLSGSRSYLFGTEGSNGTFVQYSFISSRLPVNTRGIVTIDDGGNGIYVDGVRTYSHTMDFHRGSLTFGAYRSYTQGNRRNHYLFGCKVYDVNGVLIADLIPSRKGNYAALKDSVTGNVYSANKTYYCEYIET